MRDLIIVDNAPVSYMFQPENAIPILSWYNSKVDRELIKLVPLLDKLSQCGDVREHLLGMNINNRLDFNRV